MKLRDMILFGMMLTGFAGCADFLDVQPQDKQSEKQLFATRGGYYMAVRRIYTKIAASALYGKNLSFELVDVISKRYQPLLANTYLTALSTFAYTDNSVEKELSSTWTAAYNTILNCNVVLENIDGSVGVLPYHATTKRILSNTNSTPYHTPEKTQATTKWNHARESDLVLVSHIFHIYFREHGIHALSRSFYCSYYTIRHHEYIRNQVIKKDTIPT